jgi:hypothetical protein
LERADAASERVGDADDSARQAVALNGAYRLMVVVQAISRYHRAVIQ